MKRNISHEKHSLVKTQVTWRQSQQIRAFPVCFQSLSLLVEQHSPKGRSCLKSTWRPSSGMLLLTDRSLWALHMRFLGKIDIVTFHENSFNFNTNAKLIHASSENLGNRISEKKSFIFYHLVITVANLASWYMCFQTLIKNQQIYIYK